MTNMRMIFRSKLMALGVAFEILALMAVAWNWYDNSLWLPNAALTLATLGAVIVAGRVAWDYHGRGLNGRQREEVNDIVSSSSLNPTQKEEVTQITESSGLNPRQREAVNEILLGSDLNKIQKDAVAQIFAESGLSATQVDDLPDKLMNMSLWRMVSAQQASVTALNYLRQKRHGRVAVLTNDDVGLVEVQCIDPPGDALSCERQHEREDGDTDNSLTIAASHLQRFAGDTVMWLPPAGNGINYTNGAVHSTMAVDGRRWVFSFEDCVPKRLDPVAGEYVLTRDHSGSYAWVRKS